MAKITHGTACNRLFLVLILISFINYPGFGQTVALPVNDEGKVEYTNTVDTDSIDYFTLWNNAGEFLSSLTVPDQLTKEVQTNEDLTELRHQFGFYLIVKPALTKQVDGVMMADIMVKIIDSKYTYTISNFRFIKYARDRFGQFVPKSSKKYPLEKYYPDSKKKTWKAHFVEINDKIAKLQLNLEGKIIK